MASYKKDAIRGFSWSAIEKFASQFIAFVLGIIMARLLAPSDYGVIGMLGIFMAICATVSDSGFSSALIQKKDKTEDDYSTAYLFNIGISVFLYIIFFISAPWIANFYNTPILKPVARVVSLQLILNALFNVQVTKMSIDLKFKEMSIMSIVSQILTGIVGVILAYSGLGVWALVWQSIFSCVLRGLLTIWYTKWIPAFRFSKDSFNALFGFGSKILVSSLINTVYNNLYTLVIGKKFSPSEVGYFNRANTLSGFPSKIATSMITSVNYPILSKIQDDDERLLRTYKYMTTVPLFVLYPILIGLAVLAQPIVLLLLGEKWLPCVPLVQIMCVGAMFSPLTSINLNLLYVKGRTDLVLKLELMKKPIGFAIVLITMNFGITWLVIGRIAYEFIAFTFNCYYTGKILNYGWASQMKEILPIIIKSAMMGCVVYFVFKSLHGAWSQVLIGTLVGMIIYALIALITKDESFKEVINLIKESLFKKNIES